MKQRDRRILGQFEDDLRAAVLNARAAGVPTARVLEVLRRVCDETHELLIKENLRRITR